MKIGIFGGSFNPIHTGHIRLGEALCRQGWVDELWFLVSPLNPLKQSATDLLADEARLHLAVLAIQGKPHLRVSDFEMHLPRPSYMVRTLELLRQQHPTDEFLLIIGADNWQRFPQWRDSQKILRHHRILVYPRPGYPLDPTTLPQGVQSVRTPLLDISSTQIRQAIRAGGYRGQGLPKIVWKEIKQNRYYLL